MTTRWSTLGPGQRVGADEEISFAKRRRALCQERRAESAAAMRELLSEDGFEQVLRSRWHLVRRIKAPDHGQRRIGRGDTEVGQQTDLSFGPALTKNSREPLERSQDPIAIQHASILKPDTTAGFRLDPTGLTRWTNK